MKLSAISIALLTASSQLTPGLAQQKFDLTTNFREPKNILFSCNLGGASHVLWVLETLQELSVRGHHVAWLTKEDQVKFIKDYPSVKLIVNGPGVFGKGEYRTLFEQASHMDPVRKSVHLFSRTTLNYTDEYLKHRVVFDTEQVDLVICDALNRACVEAAKATKIPSVITASLAVSPDASAPYVNTKFFNMHHPTSKGQSFYTRFTDRVISPVRFIIGSLPQIKKYTQQMKLVGIKAPINPMDNWKDSIKIINSVFGFEVPRPLGPLVELVGPILPQNYPDLNVELKAFLDSHHKVVYVGFGQMAVPTHKDIKLILTALLENMEIQNIDGIIWSTRGIRDLFPDTITTRSKAVYDINSFFESPANSSNIAFIDWAPQVAILHHPSTRLFITHGGAGSLYESMHAGVPVAVVPFFADQPGNAVMAEETGIGRWFRRTLSQVKANALVKEILEDKTGQYRRNVNHRKALVQIRNERGRQRAADLIEEALFTHNGGKITHRRDVRRDLSFFKAYNLDIHLALLASLLTLVYSIYRLAISAYMLASRRVVIEKFKIDKKLKAN
ncbi:hypothetical protein RMATCC62417_12372 [Rhizopus microsporus]|nr:hypothetical protein RMATCC62417_12372 [Rhizopus microsporus]